MRLFHVTPNQNLRSIGKEGIDPRYSRGARQECWFVSRSKVEWAILHVAKRHGVNIGEVAILEVLARREQFTRRRRGMYTRKAVLPSFYITDSYDLFDILGYSPQVDGAGMETADPSSGRVKQAPVPGVTPGRENGGQAS